MSALDPLLVVCVARRLDVLGDRFVLVGGAVRGLLMTDPRGPSISASGGEDLRDVPTEPQERDSSNGCAMLWT